ncbi:MAG: hypothetical protein H7Z19_13655 [Chitinophagaceae bacterium]|nr:hypothetical protein [Rubrivivax sp.]
MTTPGAASPPPPQGGDPSGPAEPDPPRPLASGFDAAAALVQLKRALRDLKLAERGTGFELRGKRVAELVLADGAIDARVARRPMLTPEWDRSTLRSVTDQRRWLDDLKKRLERWARDAD